MTRPSLTSAAVAAMFSQETDEAFLVLITISHPDLSEPMRVTSDSVPTVSRGDTFINYVFGFVLPSDEEGSPPQTQIVIDNVNKIIVDTLRSISTPAQFLIEIVRSSDPDTVEVMYDGFEMKTVRGDVFQISGELTIEDIATEPYPYRLFSPAEFRGLFS